MKIITVSLLFASYLIGLFYSNTARAELNSTRAEQNAQPKSATVYQTSWLIDAPLLATGVALWAVPQFFLDDLITPDCPCSKSKLNFLDRPFTGSTRASVAWASDLALAGLLTAPLLGEISETVTGKQSLRSLIDDVTVITEAVVLSGAFNQMLKIVIHQPRPFIYDLPANSPALREPDNYLSFYSAHTSTIFAAGVGYAYTFALKHPQTLAKYWVYGAALAAGSAIGVLRVAAHQHFPTDVLVGALAGSTFGLTVPWLHQKKSRASYALMPLPISDGAMIGALGIFE